MRAASRSSLLMPLSPADRITIANPTHIHMPTMMSMKVSRGHEADGHRDEDQGLDARFIPHPVGQHRDEQAKDDGETGEERDPEEVVADRLPEEGLPEQVEVVVHSDPRLGLPVLQTEDRRGDGWVDEEGPQECAAGKKPKPRRNA